MRRLILAAWVYLINNAKHLKRSFDRMPGTFQEVIGDKVMPIMVDLTALQSQVVHAENHQSLGEFAKYLP